MKVSKYILLFISFLYCESDLTDLRFNNNITSNYSTNDDTVNFPVHSGLLVMAYRPKKSRVPKNPIGDQGRLVGIL